MLDHIDEFRLIAMCRVLGVHRSGYYAWRRAPQGPRLREDGRPVGLIKHHWIASGGVYGHRKLTVDLRETGEVCSRHRVLRLMQAEGLRAQIGYGSKPRHRGGPLVRWLTFLLATSRPMLRIRPGQRTLPTFARMKAGCIWAAVMDLYSRQIVGWAMRPTMTSDLALQALLAAVWRRKPGPGVLVHSDQGSQYTSDDWQSFLTSHGMVASMSRRGNCHDNAVAESFFSLLKKGRIKRRVYPDRAAASSDVFDYIEMFYYPVRRHGFTADLSPVEFERRYAQTGS